MAYDPIKFWRDYYAAREAGQTMNRLGLGRFGTPPPSGSAVMGGAAPSTSNALVPITKEGVRVGEGIVEAAARPASTSRALVPYVAPVADDAALAAAERGGLLAAARGALPSLAPLATRTGMLQAGIPAAIGSIGGNMLDESNLLGGSESKANDTVSKALKWGGTGAGLGLALGGPAGALVGGAAGGVVGVIHQGLEEQGILGGPSKQEQIATTINRANDAARQIGLPGEVTGQLTASYEAEKAFLDPKDKAAELDLANRYAAAVQQAATAYAEDPSAFNTPETSTRAAQQAALADNLIMQSVMVNAVKPYANNFLTQSNAQADAFDAMANSAGEYAPMYREMAATTRASGARQAMEIVQQAQISPYQQALANQANYLKQVSQQVVSQAIGNVMNPQTSQSGGSSTDLTALVEQYANAAQPQ